MRTGNGCSLALTKVEVLVAHQGPDSFVFLKRCGLTVTCSLSARLIVGSHVTRIEKENKDRAKRGEDQRDTQGNDFDRDVLAECERLTNDGKEQKEHKNEVLEA